MGEEVWTVGSLGQESWEGPGSLRDLEAAPHVGKLHAEGWFQGTQGAALKTQPRSPQSKKWEGGELPGSPVVRTLRFHG